MHLVLLETSGNQAYIFGTNKQRENVGASELVYQVGSSWALEAVNETCGTSIPTDLPASWRATLLDPKRNPPIEKGGVAEVVLAASGKVLLLVDTEERGRAVIRALTLRVLREAPGLGVRGVVGPAIESGPEIHQHVREVHEDLRVAISNLPPVEARFLRLPAWAECETSGQPAASRDPRKLDGHRALRSAPNAAKHKGISGAHTRLAEGESSPRLAVTVQQLEDCIEGGLEWLGVVHADGNGIGKIFGQFDRYVKRGRPDRFFRAYLDALRKFSIGLDVACEQAFEVVAKALAGGGEGSSDDRVPIVPLVLGGDDITVLADGREAVGFAREFLRQFEVQTARKDLPLVGNIVAQTAKAALGVRRLAACAGVAIVKPSYPFFSAYTMAAALLENAKTVKKRIVVEGKPYPTSALDYHVQYADVPDLEGLRAGLELEDGARLWARPYVVTPFEKLPELDGDAARWLRRRRWSRLAERLAILTEKVDGRWALPRSVLHRLKAALHAGRSAADAALALELPRYERLASLLETEQSAETRASLFWQETGLDGRDRQRTSLLDLLDLVEFSRGFEEEEAA